MTQPSSQTAPNTPAVASHGPSAHAAAQPAAAAPAVQRQFVNFSFYKLDPAFRRLAPELKEQARAEFQLLFRHHPRGLMCLTYSTAGLRPDTDFLLWRISGSP